MCRTIYFADKILLFSSRPVGEPYHEIPLEAGTTLPQAKILNFLETFNFVAVVTPDPDRCFAAFAAAFRLVEAADATLRPQTEEGIDRVCWCTPAEVELHLQQTFPTIRRVFAKL